MDTRDPRAVLAEENLSAFLLAMGRAGGGEERRADEVVWTVGGSPIGYHNAVVHCYASPDQADALIEEWTSELRSRGLTGSWHVSPTMRPPDLMERLAAAGFEDGGDEPAMVADLAHPLATRRPVDGLTIERIRDARGLQAFREVLARSFGEGPAEADWVVGVYGRIGLGDDTAWRHYVGWVAGDVVSTVSLFITADVAGVYFVATAPELRRRGIGAAITHHALVEAAGLGCTTAVLGSSPMGYGVYRGLGFEEVFRYRLWEWEP